MPQIRKFKSIFDQEPMDWLASFPGQEILEYLVSHGADVNKANESQSLNRVYSATWEGLSRLETRCICLSQR